MSADNELKKQTVFKEGTGDEKKVSDVKTR